MNSNKIVFFDIDGTLLDHQKNLPRSTKEAIHQLKQTGVHVAIATGRAPFMYKELREELGISSYVSFNGQYVVLNNEVIYKNPLSKNRLEHILNFSKDKKHPLVYLDHNTMRASEDNHHYIHESLGSLKFSHPEVDPTYFLNNEIYQALLFCTSEEEHEYLQAYDDLHFIRWHDVSIDILPKGGSKAEGIKQMIQKLNIHVDNVVAFGDGLNDIEMIEFVGTGVAMGNAKEEIKNVANVVTKNVDDHGIIHGLEKIGLL
ncbi:Cof-type HAD-IIB family hydrolase [Bacillus timonensis]|nr:Cof-type HAD-IIB family hydrolase [Bacillus timonensis]